MGSLFCCGALAPYRPQYLQHQSKFTSFMSWAAFPRETSPASTADGGPEQASPTPKYAVQLVRQVNFGPLESKRYFVPAHGKQDEFIEVTEGDLIQANFQKLNTYKNYKCATHNRFFEVNIYQKDPVNNHHWRANLARPASLIDL